MKSGIFKANYCRSRKLISNRNLTTVTTESDQLNPLTLVFKFLPSEFHYIKNKKQNRIICSHIQQPAWQLNNWSVFLDMKGFTCITFSLYFLNPFCRWTVYLNTVSEIFSFYSLTRHLPNFCEDLSARRSLLLLHSSIQLYLYLAH